MPSQELLFRFIEIVVESLSQGRGNRWLLFFVSHCHWGCVVASGLWCEHRWIAFAMKGDLDGAFRFAHKGHDGIGDVD